MELNKIFKDGLWSTEINVRDFVSHNITPYYGDASFLEGPTERTKAVWNRCLEALAEERANNGVRSLDNVTVSTITSTPFSWQALLTTLIPPKGLIARFRSSSVCRPTD